MFYVNILENKIFKNDLSIKIDQKKCLTSNCSWVGSGDLSGIASPFGSSKGSSRIMVCDTLWNKIIEYKQNNMNSIQGKKTKKKIKLTVVW